MTKNSRAANACKISVLLLFSSILLGCNFAPSYQQPQDVVAATVPDATPAPALAPAVLAAAQADALQWLADDRLRHTVALALHNNRDLRIAADNVAKARAQYGIARADQLPSITAQLQGQRSRSSADVSNSTRLVNEQVSASIGFASYEVDLWGRIRNLNAAAWQQFLQVQENRRGVEIALIAEVANAWLTLAADQERLALAQQTLDTREQSYALMRRMFQLGATSGLALAQNLLARGIRVNAVAPGPVWTPFNPADKPAEEVAQFGKDSAMGRPAQPEELSPAYVFLASPVMSSYVNGIVLPVMGGPKG